MPLPKAASDIIAWLGLKPWPSCALLVLLALRPEGEGERADREQARDSEDRRSRRARSRRRVEQPGRTVAMHEELHAGRELLLRAARLGLLLHGGEVPAEDLEEFSAARPTTA